MLGAVRILAGCENLGSLLLKDLVRLLIEQYSALQIQAAVNERDYSALKMLENANFRHLTDVDQMWLDTRQAQSSKKEVTIHLTTVPLQSRHHELAIEWAPAASISQAAFVEMMESTFVGSLDCPELNGLRNSQDVLASFLMGREFQETSNWEIAHVHGEPVGCLLMADHPNSVSELVYMGLVPAARRRGLGRQVVLRATESAQRLNQNGVVLAVDVRNIPAIRAYQECGFRFHCRLKVFLGSVSS